MLAWLALASRGYLQDFEADPSRFMSCVNAGSLIGSCILDHRIGAYSSAMLKLFGVDVLQTLLLLKPLAEDNLEAEMYTGSDCHSLERQAVAYMMPAGPRPCVTMCFRGLMVV